MQRLYIKTKSAIATGHLAFPTPQPGYHRPCTGKNNARKSASPFNNSCDENTQAIHVYQHPIHSKMAASLSQTLPLRT
jgi:hypothetical protein